MELTSTKEEDYYCIEIDGDVDASSAIDLDSEIEAAFKSGESKILVDCKKLEYISSAGLGVFMSYLSDFEEKGISMVLFEVSEKVQNVFKILGLDSLVQMVASKEDAKTACNPS